MASAHFFRRSQGLELVATIKASQIASNLDLLETTCKTISTRLLVQSSLRRYNQGNRSSNNWAYAIPDLQSALGSRGYLSLYQAILFSKDGSGDGRILNVTSDTVPEIVLPNSYSNGTSAKLGSEELGYPSMLYPNLTYTSSADNENSTTVLAFPEYTLGLGSTLLLGPLKINNSFSLISLTVPIVNNTSDTDLLGFITYVPRPSYEFDAPIPFHRRIKLILDRIQDCRQRNECPKRHQLARWIRQYGTSPVARSISTRKFVCGHSPSSDIHLKSKFSSTRKCRGTLYLRTYSTTWPEQSA